MAQRNRPPGFWKEVEARRLARYGPRATRKASLQKRYRITIEDYAERLAAQGGGCAICGEPCPTGNLLAVDHDHASGQVRGLLCLRCNLGLGQFRDQPALLRRAIAYLGESYV